MSGSPRHAAAWFVLLLLPALPGLGSSSHAGMIHLQWSVFPVLIEDKDCGTSPATNSLDQASMLETPAGEDSPQAQHLPALNKSGRCKPPGSSSPCPTNFCPSGDLFSSCSDCDPAPPCLAARLVIRQSLFISDPSLSSLFRPPRPASCAGALAPAFLLALTV